MIEIICNYCESGFLVHERYPWAKYCSTPCRNKAAQVRAREALVERPCPQCKNLYMPRESRQKFCSSSCSATFHNPRTKRKPRQYIECRCCDQKLLKSQDQFCGHKCRTVFQAYKRYDLWVQGFIDASDANGLLKGWARNLLIEMCGNRCSQCGWGEVNPVIGRPILTVDHVDGNWSNNFCWNLVVLCYNCHTLTPTFGSLNAGSVSGRRSNAVTRDVRIV